MCAGAAAYLMKIGRPTVAMQLPLRLVMQRCPTGTKLKSWLSSLWYKGTEMSKRYAVVPHPKLKREYKGRLVRTTRVLKTAGVIPLGAVATVTHQSPKGSELTFEPCDCCGLKAIISHVAWTPLNLSNRLLRKKMDENKLNIETVDGHNELVVSFCPEW